MRARDKSRSERRLVDLKRDDGPRAAWDKKVLRFAGWLEAQALSAEIELQAAAHAYATVVLMKQRLSAIRGTGEQPPQPASRKLWFPLDPNIKHIFLGNASRGAEFERDLVSDRLQELQAKATLTEEEYYEAAELQVTLEPLLD